MKKAIIISILFLIFSSILSGCSEKKESNKENGKLLIYTTVYPLQYFTERIAGDLVTVESIYPPGADEHTFEPSQRDMMNIADANSFFYIGLGLEGFVEKAKTTLKNEDVQFVPVGEKINLEKSASVHEEGSEHEEHSEHEEYSEHEEHDEHEEHQHGDIDPHVWLDPLYAKEIALAIKDTLVTQLPEEEKTLEQNYEQLVKDLDDLHSSFQSTIESAKHKEIIVSHAAFGYWEKRYGLQQINISGLSSASEPSQKDLEEIVKIAKEKNIHYIFFEQNISSKLGEIIQQEIGAKPLFLHNLSTLTEENIKKNENYFTLMNQNVESLKTGLK